MIRCRVFKERYIWSEQLFFIPENITLTELKGHVQTSWLSKENYVCISNFEEEFINKLIKRSLNSKFYYYI